MDFCVNDRVAGPETDASSAGNGYAAPASSLGEVAYRWVPWSPYIGGICAAGGSLAAGRGCAVAAAVVGDTDDDTSSAVVVIVVVAAAVVATGTEVGG